MAYDRYHYPGSHIRNQEQTNRYCLQKMPLSQKKRYPLTQYLFNLRQTKLTHDPLHLNCSLRSRLLRIRLRGMKLPML